MKNKEQPFDENIFDKKIRAALDNIQVSYNHRHWKLMQEKLDVLDAQDNNFDKNILKTIETTQSEFNPLHWNSFVSQLEADNKLNNNFDTTIAENINRVEPLYNPANWNAFAAKLDAEEKKDAGFDDTIADNLRKTEPRFNPEHWDKMSKILDEHFTWYGKIVRYKVIELAVLLLAVLSTINIMETNFVPAPMHHQRNPTIKQVVPIPKDSASIFAAASLKIKSGNFVSNDIMSADKRTGIEGSIKIEPTPTSLKNKIIVLSNSQTVSFNAIGDNKLTDNFETKNSIAVLQVLNVSELSNEKTKLWEKINQQDVLVLSSDIKTQQEDIILAAEAQITPILPINTLNADVLALNNTLEVSPPVRLTIADMKSKKHWQIGVQMSGNTDFVNTSFFSNNRELPVSEVAYSAAGGLTLSYTHKNSEFEAGLIYGSKTYASNVSFTGGSLFTGYVQKSPGEVEFRLLSATLGVRQTLWEKKRFSLFARLGATFHSVINVFDKRVTESTLSTADQNALIQRSADRVATYDNTNNKNFLTADLGLGVNYKINNRWAMFLQSSYHQHISEQGIGSLNDHLNSLALDAGLKIVIR